MPIIKLSCVSLLLISTFIQPQSCRADTVQLDAAKDNTLYETLNGDLSNGAGTGLFVGNTLQGGGIDTRRTLIMFDVAAQLPSDAVVTNATLNITADLVAGAGLSESVDLYRVATDWGEASSIANFPGSGGGAGAPAEPGDATWTDSMLGSSTWANLGGDFVQDLTASTRVGGAGSYSWTSQQLIVDVQDMLLEPQDNFGWILLGNESFGETAKRFGSRESSIPPVLTIEFDVPGGGLDPDFDDDDDVDDEDLGTWTNAYGSGDGGDADGDSDTDGADYLAWQNEYTGSAGLQTAVIPEPSSIVLALSLVAATALNRPRRP